MAISSANGTRAGPPGPYICALLRGFCEKVSHHSIEILDGLEFVEAQLGGGWGAAGLRAVSVSWEALPY